MLVQPLFSKIKNNASKTDAQYFYKHKHIWSQYQIPKPKEVEEKNGLF